MAEAVGALRGRPVALLERPTFATVRETVLPVLVVLLFLFALTATLGRAGSLRSWSADYSGSGQYLVESCSEVLNRGADQWSCSGWFTTTGQNSTEQTRLVTSLGAYASERPFVGQEMDVFFEVGNFDQVYPASYQLNELARLYLSLIPRLLLMVGALLWLAGWFATRNLDSNDPVTRDTVRFPQRFNWRNQGVTWMAVAIGLFILNYVVVTRVIGSLGVI